MIPAMEILFRETLEQTCRHAFGPTKITSYPNLHIEYGDVPSFDEWAHKISLAKDDTGSIRWQIVRDLESSTEDFQKTQWGVFLTDWHRRKKEEVAAINLSAHMLCDPHFLRGEVTTLKRLRKLLARYRTSVASMLPKSIISETRILVAFDNTSFGFLLIPRNTGRQSWTENQCETVREIAEDLLRCVDKDNYTWFDFVWSIVEFEGCYQVQQDGACLLDVNACDHCFSKILVAVEATNLEETQRAHKLILTAAYAATSVLAVGARLSRTQLPTIVENASNRAGLNPETTSSMLTHLPDLLWSRFKPLHSTKQTSDTMIHIVFLNGEDHSSESKKLDGLSSREQSRSQIALIIDDRNPTRKCWVFGKMVSLGPILSEYALFFAKRKRDSLVTYIDITKAIYPSRWKDEPGFRLSGDTKKLIQTSVRQRFCRLGNPGTTLWNVIRKVRNVDAFEIDRDATFIYFPPQASQ